MLYSLIAASSEAALFNTNRMPLAWLRNANRTNHTSQKPPCIIASQPPATLEHQVPKTTITSYLVSALCVSYAAQVMFPRLTKVLRKTNSGIGRRKQLWRLLTPIFMHASFSHLISNVDALLIIGPDCEAWFGRKRLFGTFIGSGIIGCIASWMYTPNPSLGASGAIFGLTGAWTIFLIENSCFIGRKEATAGLRNIALTLIINAVFAYVAPPHIHLDHSCHIGGFIGGFVIALFCGPRIRRRLDIWGNEILCDYSRINQMAMAPLVLPVQGSIGIASWAP